VINKPANGGERLRWWYLPSWLGLDAPCVVSTWTLAVALGCDLSYQAVAMAALFSTVWSIYLLDRLVDVARCSDWSHVTGRMQFGHRFRWLFAACFVFAASMLLAILVFGRLSPAVITRGFGVALGLLTYASLFVLPIVFRERLRGKEIGVGLFFALGGFAVLGANANSIPMFLGVWCVVSFNCLVIAARERDTDALTDPSGASQWWLTIDRDLTWLGIGCATIAIGVAVFAAAKPFFVVLAAAFVLLVILHRTAKSLSADAVRAVADFCLLTPWLWFARLAWST